MLMEGRLYIGGLNLSTTKQDIDREFGKYGSLRDVWLARNPPGFAFIEYYNTQDAEQAMRDLDGHNFLGSHIRVEPSKGKGRQDSGGSSGGGMRGGDRGGRRGGSGAFRGGSSRGSVMRASRGGRGDGPGVPRGNRGPPQSYNSFSEYSSRGGSGGAGYRDEPRSRYSGDAYAGRYESAPYRSRSPIRRRSPLPTTRGRDFGGRDFGAASRDYGGGSREYSSGRAYGGAVPDYASPSREYTSARGYPARDGGHEREYRTAAASGGASGRYDRGDFDRYPRYERAQPSYSDRSRRSPPPRR